MILSVRLDVWLSGGRELKRGSAGWRWLAHVVATGAGEPLVIKESMEPSSLEEALAEAIAGATGGSVARDSGRFSGEVSAGTVRIGLAGERRVEHHPLESAVTLDLTAVDLVLARQPDETLARWDGRLERISEDLASLKPILERLDAAAIECLRGLERALRRTMPVARLARVARISRLPRRPRAGEASRGGVEGFGFEDATVGLLDALAARPCVPAADDWSGGGFDALGGEETFDTGGGGFDGAADDTGGGSL